MEKTERRAELDSAIELLKVLRSNGPEPLRPGLDRAIQALEERLVAQATVPSSSPRPRPSAPAKPRLPGRVAFDDEDLRCPHCAVVVLKRERIRLDVERGGAPEFCPRCGERTGEEPPPIAV